MQIKLISLASISVLLYNVLISFDSGLLRWATLYIVNKLVFDV